MYVWSGGRVVQATDRFETSKFGIQNFHNLGGHGIEPRTRQKHIQVDISYKLPCGPVAEWFRRQISELPSPSGDRAPGLSRR